MRLDYQILLKSLPEPYWQDPSLSNVGWAAGRTF